MASWNWRRLGIHACKWCWGNDDITPKRKPCNLTKPKSFPAWNTQPQLSTTPFLSTWLPWTARKIRSCRPWESLPRDALMKFKLAPLRTRHDMALLGFLRRLAHLAAPSCFTELFRFGGASAFVRRRHPPAHARQIHDPIDGTQSRALERSVYGPIYTFKSLAAEVMEAATFQRRLQRAVIKACDSTAIGEQWPWVLRAGVRKVSLQTPNDLFRGCVVANFPGSTTIAHTVIS
jgi:hypothetical protein